MNREQKRAFVKRAKKQGVKESDAKTYADIISEGVGKNTPEQEINEGDKILLNLDAIMSRKNYNKMNKEYRDFVESNSGTVFTAHIEHKKLISLTENPRWLFWSGDLIKWYDESKEAELKQAYTETALETEV